MRRSFVGIESKLSVGVASTEGSPTSTQKVKLASQNELPPEVSPEKELAMSASKQLVYEEEDPMELATVTLGQNKTLNEQCNKIIRIQKF